MIKRTTGQFRNKFGKLVKGISSFLLEDDELSDVQNMLPGYEWRQRKGQSELTTTEIAPNVEFKSMFQFRQLNVTGDFLLAHIRDPALGDRIARASAIPPATGITWTNEFILPTASNPGQWAQVQDAVVFADNSKFLIWRGTDHFPTGVWIRDDSEDVFISFWDELTDGRTTSFMTLTSFPTADRIYIMSDMPFNKISITMKDINQTASLMSVFIFTTAGFVAATGLVDGTRIGGVGPTLQQSGDVTWTFDGSEAQTLVDGQKGFAVYLTFSAVLEATGVEMSGLLMEHDFGEVANVWDGQMIEPFGAYVTPDDVGFEDYLAKVLNTATTDFLQAGGLTTSGFIYVAFNRRANFIQFEPVTGFEQSNNVSVDTVEYWSTSGAWTTVTGVVDTTEVVNKTLFQKGTISWNEIDEDLEKARLVSADINPWFWYRIKFDDTMSAEARVFRIQGIPTPDSIDESFGVTAWKRRAWQVGPIRRRNAVRYSADGLPNTFNGDDSGYVEFGERPLRAAIPFFNELLVFADTELWMLQGDSPATFGRLRLSARVGTDAPHSVLAIESGVIDERNIRRITIAWFFQGIWFFDGIRWWIVSAPDIDSFFDSNHPDYINPNFNDRTYGDYDVETECCYWIVYSGANQTTPNKVIVLHVPTLAYGIFTYASSISSILSTFNKRFYLVGGGFNTGKHYLLNDTDQDVDATGTAVAIDAFMITKDLWAQYDHGLKQRIFSLVMESQDQGMVELDEYPDGSKTPQSAGTKKQTALGKTLVDVQWPLKEHSGQLTAKFRIRHRSLNQPFIPFGYSTTWDRDRSEE